VAWVSGASQPSCVAVGGFVLVVEMALALAAVGIALWLRPWRCVDARGPPWVWCAAWAAVALMWGSVPGGPLLRPIAGVTLLVLMAGWPLAVLAMLAAAMLAAWGGPLAWADALQRLVWLGIVPGTCVLAVGAAVRRWLPRHQFSYILGRGYAGTLLASLLAGLVAAYTGPLGVAGKDLLVASLLVATGEAGICGTLVAILVVQRPQWVATYAERLYRST
jgi:uncharacterized membrane protein